MDGFSLSDPVALDPAAANLLLDWLGGTVAVSRLTFTSTSTVHSWRESGMPKARFDHVRLAALARGKATELKGALEEIEGEPPLPFEREAATP
jgi:hypothetical protein